MGAATSISEAALVIDRAKSSMGIIWVLFNTELILHYVYQNFCNLAILPNSSRVSTSLLVAWDYNQALGITTKHEQALPKTRKHLVHYFVLICAHV